MDMLLFQLVHHVLLNSTLYTPRIIQRWGKLKGLHMGGLQNGSVGQPLKLKVSFLLNLQGMENPNAWHFIVSHSPSQNTLYCAARLSSRGTNPIMPLKGVRGQRPPPPPTPPKSKLWKPFLALNHFWNSHSQNTLYCALSRPPPKENKQGLVDT